MASAPSYSKKNLALVQSMAPQIATVAVRYGVPAEAIAGSLAQEQFDQTASSWNQSESSRLVSLCERISYQAYAIGLATNPLNPEQGASAYILGQYNANPNAVTVGSDLLTKYHEPLLVDYGPAGMKFHNAIGQFCRIETTPPSRHM